MVCSNYNLALVSLLLGCFMLSCGTSDQHGNHSNHEHHHEASQDGVMPYVTDVDAQPVVAHAVRVDEALAFMGGALPKSVSDQLKNLATKSYQKSSVDKVQELLDPFCIAAVEINPESRVKVMRGPADAELMQEGWKIFLVKVHNQAAVTAQLEVESPNILPVFHVSTGDHRMRDENHLTDGEVDNQFLEASIYRGRPLSPRLSGLALEYVPVQLYTRARGQRQVTLGFNVGHGSQDLGFRNHVDVLFDIQPSVKVKLNPIDQDGSPTMASFTITDGRERYHDAKFRRWGGDYWRNMARTQHWQESVSVEDNDLITLDAEDRLIGIYPLPSKRLATRDEFPDFFFQPQVYRGYGEHVYLPPGEYHVNYGRGPEYLNKYQKIIVPTDVDSIELEFELDRWIHMKELGWYSADHHIHASGCSHYESPEEGVLPEHMWRQVIGEDLDMGNNLTWGPSWYYQKQFFTGEDHELSDSNNILRYDVEVSGFPSSHAGHIVLLNLREDDFPGTEKVGDWPTWTLPILSWAKAQGGITGYAHSGWGLAPKTPTDDLPNYVTPNMDGIGANEYIVTVTHDVIDFFSAGDTPIPYELNMWYHTLNSGFRIPISGETDFPCISDEKVGRARIYAKLEKGLTFQEYMQALKAGRSYVSDGYSHLIEYSVNDQSLGLGDNQIDLQSSGFVDVSVRAVAYLDETQDKIGRVIASLAPNQSPYWHIERSRLGSSRQVKVELVANGMPVQEKVITADGNWNEVTFEHEISKSSWLAIRIHGSSHTNPIYIHVNGEPIVEKRSAQWCRDAVDQCWKMKKSGMKHVDRVEARKAYNHARKTYDDLILLADKLEQRIN